jgi:hypothetical protein
VPTNPANGSSKEQHFDILIKTEINSKDAYVLIFVGDQSQKDELTPSYMWQRVFEVMHEYQNKDSDKPGLSPI